MTMVAKNACKIVVTVFQEKKKERKEVKRVKNYMYK